MRLKHEIPPCEVLKMEGRTECTVDEALRPQLDRGVPQFEIGRKHVARDGKRQTEATWMFRLL